MIGGSKCLFDPVNEHGLCVIFVIIICVVSTIKMSTRPWLIWSYVVNGMAILNFPKKGHKYENNDKCTLIAQFISDTSSLKYNKI